MNASIESGRRAGFPLVAVLDARAWRGRLETYSATMGFRPLLSHVPNERWCARYAANEDAFEAVAAELSAIAD